MRMLPVDKSMQLTQLSKMVGPQNTTPVLIANGIDRVVDVGKAVYDRCSNIISSTYNTVLSKQRKVTWLNWLRGDSDLFESAAMFSEYEWNVLDNTGTFPYTLNIPDGMNLVDSSTIIGNNTPTDNLVAKEAVNQMQQYGKIDPALFITYSTIPSTNTGYVHTSGVHNVFECFKIPWGEVTLYSALSNEHQDFPVYPEKLSDKAVADYDTMPDILYQYEPWYVYRSSGPRENQYVFDFHRDMWTGDHRDGYAYRLIQFCKANCYPRYSGSAVNTSFVTLYIGGQPIIHGILKEVNDDWDGPLGLDKRPLHCTLTLTIAEVSKESLNYDYVKNNYPKEVHSQDVTETKLL